VIEHLHRAGLAATARSDQLRVIGERGRGADPRLGERGCRENGGSIDEVAHDLSGAVRTIGM
jgi:hypothetical protein